MDDVREMGLGADDAASIIICSAGDAFFSTYDTTCAALRMADADTQARVVGSAEFLGDIDQSIVTNRRRHRFSAARFRRQVQLVVHHENFRGRDFVIVGEL